MALVGLGFELRINDSNIWYVCSDVVLQPHFCILFKYWREKKKKNYLGSVWQCILNNSFQCLNNITRISTHFFTHTYFQKIQATLLERHYQTGLKVFVFDLKLYLASCAEHGLINNLIGLSLCGIQSRTTVCARNSFQCCQFLDPLKHNWINLGIQPSYYLVKLIKSRLTQSNNHIK